MICVHRLRVAALRIDQIVEGGPEAQLEEAVAVFDAGTFLFREGEPAHGFYIVQKGALNVHRVNAAGKEQIIDLLEARMTVAESSMANLLALGVYPLTFTGGMTRKDLSLDKQSSLSFEGLDRLDVGAGIGLL